MKLTRMLSVTACIAVISMFAASLAVAEVVTVDAGKDLGPATYRASGFLHAMSKTVPATDMIAPLKPQLFRMAAEDWHKIGAGSFANYERVKQLGARMQVVISDNHGYGLAGWWPGDNGDWTAWDFIVESLVKRVQADKQKVEWDIWNEPNGRYFWGRDLAQFNETWKRGYQKIRSLDPKATIVGPSIAGYDRKYLEAFLEYAKANDVVPDLLAWHEFGNPRKIPTHFAEMREFVQKNGLKVRGYSINEIITGTQQPKPGVTLVYLANLDREGADGACHACWGDQDPKVSGCENQTLDGLLTYPDRKPRASWWAYKAYADVTGRLVELKPSETIDGIAGVDAKSKAVNIALGREGGEVGDVELVIASAGKLKFLGKSGAVHVVAKRLVTSGWEESAGPVLVFEADYKIESDQIKLVLPQFGPTDAFVVTLTPVKSERETGEAGAPAARQAFDKGIELATKSRLTEAIVEFKRAIDLDPKYAEAHFRLGRCYVRSSDAVAATACFRKCLSIDPAHDGAKAELAKLKAD